ncbi:MAG TPA: MscL family protein [Candidatus Paceibacterota bacterium]|jgi:large conductance mechanosensitive channel|nr:MscL family protein [Candidatus Paceibacterota bacterium]
MNIFRDQLKGFVHFVRTQGVVGFAVGFILGKAMSDLVNSLVTDIINPLVGVVFGKFSDLAKLSVTIDGSVVKYGNFISLGINFVILALVVYFVIKKAADLFDRPKDIPPAK